MSVRGWGQLDEGIPQHVLARNARGMDQLQTSFLVPKNFYDMIRQDFSHYANAKRSPDPWLNSYKCFDILLGIVRTMQRDHQGRFAEKIKQADIEKKADRLEKILYGDNSKEWVEIVRERYPGVVANVIKKDVEQGSESTIDSFAFPFKRAAANLFFLSMSLYLLYNW